MSESLWPYRLQHAWLPCLSLSSGVCLNSSLLYHWWHPTISSSVAPFSSCPQSFPASGSFPMSRLFITDGQHIRASASASVLPMNIQGWFPLGLTGFISLLSLVSSIMQCLRISADQSERVCMEDLNRIPMWRNGPKEGHQEWHNFRPLRKLSIFIDILRFDFVFLKMIETSDRSEEDLGWGSTSFPLVSQATELWVWRAWLYFRSSEWWS